MNKFNWTPENLAYAVEQWSRGVTSTAIAAHLGFTRNAVIGKLRRHGVLCGRPVTLPRVRATKVAEASQNAPTVTRVTPKAPRRGRVTKPKTLLKLRFATEHRRADCRWPLGDWAFGKNLHNDPPATLFCGAPAEAGTSWCAAHCRQAFQRRR
jgi:hypothetical protein